MISRSTVTGSPNAMLSPCSSRMAAGSGASWAGEEGKKGDSDVRVPFLLPRQPSGFLFVQSRQRGNDLHRLQAHADDTLDEVDDVAWLIVLPGPIVGIVDDTAVLVARDLVAFHNPFDGRLAVDDV